MMRILVVGAGAVGVTYGHHLARGGAQVDVFVRPRYADATRGGFTLCRYGLRGPKALERFVPTQVLTEPAEVARTRYDAVWLCVASDALAGDWLGPLLAATGDAALVLLAPGLDDRARVETHVDAARVVSGLITLIAWTAPLEGERALPGAQGAIAFLLPPLAPIPFSGAPRGAVDAAAALRRGGCPAVHLAEPDAVPMRAALGSALLVPLIAALEASGWSIDALARGPRLALGLDAAREAQAIGARAFGRAPPRLTALLRPGLARVVLRLARALAPFPLEPYLRKHFTKVGPQTRLALATWRRHGGEAGLPTSALERLSSELPPSGDG